MKTDAPATQRIEAYLAALPADQAAALGQLRSVVAAAAPDAVEAISYSMPAFKVGRRVLIYYAAFKDHLSLFPASGSVMDKLGADLRKHFSGKGTLQFSAEHPLPDDLVRRIIEIRREEIGA